VATDLANREEYRKAYYEKRRGFYYERGAKRRQRNYDYVNALKMAPCTDCKNTFPPICMDFDHVRGTKYKRPGMNTTGGVASMCAQGLSLKNIKAEIAKCELVCANCHRIRTAGRAKPWVRRTSLTQPSEASTLH
jgi:hypothetical protein